MSPTFIQSFNEITPNTKSKLIEKLFWFVNALKIEKKFPTEEAFRSHHLKGYWRYIPGNADHIIFYTKSPAMVKLYMVDIHARYRGGTSDAKLGNELDSIGANEEFIEFDTSQFVKVKEEQKLSPEEEEEVVKAIWYLIGENSQDAKLVLLAALKNSNWDPFFEWVDIPDKQRFDDFQLAVFAAFDGEAKLKQEINTAYSNTYRARLSN